MKTELGSLATALYVKTDDLLKDSPQLAPWRPAVGIAPQLSALVSVDNFTDATYMEPLGYPALGRAARIGLRFGF